MFTFTLGGLLPGFAPLNATPEGVLRIPKLAPIPTLQIPLSTLLQVGWRSGPLAGEPASKKTRLAGKLDKNQLHNGITFQEKHNRRNRE